MKNLLSSSMIFINWVSVFFITNLWKCLHKLPENGNLVLKIKQGGFISHPILLHWEIKSSAPVRTVAFAPQTRRIMNKFVLRQSLLLLLTATIWGVAFVAQSVGMDYVGPFTFNCIRCLIGAVVLVPCIWFLDGWKQRPDGVHHAAENQPGRHVAENQLEHQVVHHMAAMRCWQVASAVAWHCLWRAICSRSGFSIRRSERQGSSRRCTS